MIIARNTLLNRCGGLRLNKLPQIYKLTDYNQVRISHLHERSPVADRLALNGTNLIRKWKVLY